MTNLIRREDIWCLNSVYKNFVDEECRLVDIKKFADLFVYKYASFGDSWMFWIENKAEYNELHCQNIGGFKFVFPLSVI